MSIDDVFTAQSSGRCVVRAGAGEARPAKYQLHTKNADSGREIDGRVWIAEEAFWEMLGEAEVTLRFGDGSEIDARVSGWNSSLKSLSIRGMLRPRRRPAN
ncbi:MAG: hypothetical protein U1E87_08955 [Alphaproteobacteria bacterium]